MKYKLPDIKQWSRTFLMETFILFCLFLDESISYSLQGMETIEQRYHQQFEKRFDFLTFNKELTLSEGSGRYEIAFDPSYVNMNKVNCPDVDRYHSWSLN